MAVAVLPAPQPPGDEARDDRRDELLQLHKDARDDVSNSV